MVKEKLARCFNRQRFTTFLDFDAAVTYLESVINNRPLYTKKAPVTGQYVVIRPSHFIHPGHPDQFDNNMTNLFQKRTEEAATAEQLKECLDNRNEIQKTTKNDL